MPRKYYSHYDYLEEHLPLFFSELGIPWRGNAGIILAHGDKCYTHKERFEKAGLTFAQGVAIYLLTYVPPFSKESRETSEGWVDPFEWVIQNKDRFLPHLPREDT